MKLTKVILTHTLLLLIILSTASCGRAEWVKQGVVVAGSVFYFEIPKPFVEKTITVALPTGRTPWETSYTSEGDDSITYSVRKMDLPVAAWQMDGFDRRAVLGFGLSRENVTESDRIVDRKDFKVETWSEHVELAEELTVESADGKTIKHIRMMLNEREVNWAYVILSATRPKDSTRSPDIDKFFNSLKICSGDPRPGGC